MERPNLLQLKSPELSRPWKGWTDGASKTMERVHERASCLKTGTLWSASFMKWPGPRETVGPEMCDWRSAHSEKRFLNDCMHSVNPFYSGRVSPLLATDVLSPSQAGGVQQELLMGSHWRRSQCETQNECYDREPRLIKVRERRWLNVMNTFWMKPMLNYSVFRHAIVF